VIKIFVATRKGQGIRENDFSHLKGREPVRFTIECDDDGPDGHCGCKRSMSGMRSHGGTTTFTVANVKMTKEEYFELVKSSYKSWMVGSNVITEKMVHDITDELLNLAKKFKPDVILEKREFGIQVRRLKKKRKKR
jgi:hypothetical protein